jgi:SNF2 family DNA or RNA helicase
MWESDKTLILASGQEIIDHWCSHFYGKPGHRIDPIMGTGSATQRAIARDRAEASGSVLVLNYEACWRDVGALIELGFDTIICDEAHHLKNRQSATFRAVAKLARRAHHFLAVTGTPVMNSADEAWSLLHLIDPKGYPSYWRWVDEHFDVEITDFHGTAKRPIQLVKGLKDGHAEIVRKQLSPYLLQRDYDTIFPGTPVPIVRNVEVVLTEAERANYNELVRRSWTKVGDELVLTSNAVAKTTRLRQLTSSWATINAEAEHPGAKIEAAVALATSQLMETEQVLILSAYQETARRVAEEIGDDALAYTGDTPKGERRQILQQFRDGDLRVLSATIGTLGEGVDGLQVSRCLIQLDRDWTPARNEQVLARLRRGGQQSQVRVWYIEAAGTIDQAVAEALARKTVIINSLL